MIKIEKIVIATHGRFGEELKNSAEMIIGSQNQLKSCSYLEGMTLESFSKVMDEEIENDKTLVFVDLFGGTPFNVAMALGNKKNFLLVTGVNLVTLIEACMNYCTQDEKEILVHINKIHQDSFRVFNNEKELGF